MTDRELIQQAQLEKLEGTLWMLNQELTRKQAEIDALRERLKQPEQWEQLYSGMGNPFKRPATRDEKIVNPGVYEVPDTPIKEKNA
jgi:hypothetical protein